jgi:hypothetical protein
LARVPVRRLAIASVIATVLGALVAPALAKAPTPGTGAPLVFPARVGSSNRLPPGLYPAKALASGKASVHGLNCYPVEGFKSLANDRYVAAELGYGVRYPKQNGYAMLRARATHVGPWEEFQFCNVPDNPRLWAIFSHANDKWVAAEFGYPQPDKGMLRARAGHIGGPREHYGIGCIRGGGGSFVFVSYGEAPVLYYVAAEIG